MFYNVLLTIMENLTIETVLIVYCSFSY